MKSDRRLNPEGRLHAMRASNIFVVVAIGCAMGCAKHPAHESMLVCGGSLSAEDVAQRTLAATTTEYSWARLWVEEHCSTSSVPVSKRVFALRESRPRSASILQHRVSLTVADVLQERGFTTADVRVLRQIGPAKDQRIESADHTYEIQPLDVVLIGGTRK